MQVPSGIEISGLLRVLRGRLAHVSEAKAGQSAGANGSSSGDQREGRRKERQRGHLDGFPCSGDASRPCRRRFDHRILDGSGRRGPVHCRAVHSPHPNASAPGFRAWRADRVVQPAARSAADRAADSCRRSVPVFQGRRGIRQPRGAPGAPPARLLPRIHSAQPGCTRPRGQAHRLRRRQANGTR